MVLPLLVLGVLLGPVAAGWGLLAGEQELQGSSEAAASCCLGPGERPLLPCDASASEPEPCCQRLLALANSSAALTDCLMSSARPLRPCQRCQPQHSLLQEQMLNLSKALQQENTTESSRCARNLLQCDRMQIVSRLNDSSKQIWMDSNCALCLLENGEGLKNNTIHFMDMYSTTIQCFEQNRLGNSSHVCTNCSKSYKDLNDWYSEMEKNDALCVDLEDAMNSTRILWSQIFKCNIPCYDVVPVIAVSSFILFLPIVFYLSSFLHSEQKKRKLILPKRMKSATDLTNIQDKSS